MQIHTGILAGSVGVAGDNRIGVKTFEPEFHRISYHSLLPETKSKRVLTVAGVPPEKCAYALARYSRSPDSIVQSIDWVRTHDSQKFLESFYFQYGHASIADLGHVVVCLEGISELAATEAEDEQLWDGQARSSRYQDFGKSGFVSPPEFDAEQKARYLTAGQRLLQGYRKIHQAVHEHLCGKLPRPDDMKEDAYQRNITARAFDVARYLLFLGVPTGVGQVTSIRTLERQIRRLKASHYQELRDLGQEIAHACASTPDCAWDESVNLPVAPTLAKYVDSDTHLIQSRADLSLWAQQNLPPTAGLAVDAVDLLRPTDTMADITATLLFPVTDRPFRELYEMTEGWSRARQSEVMDVALRSRTRRDELLREFRGGLFAYDMVMDIGAYRDLHRHRRCHQYRQSFNGRLGFETPAAVLDCGIGDFYRDEMDHAMRTLAELPEPGSHYLLPFGARSRFLFKMDFAEAEYISRLRSGVKGHFSYREVAWKMKVKMEELEPELGRLIQATPPWVEDPLQR
ncbi:MAG: FAD-dependent thymidylate synthase [Acidobacteriia bacterium]|nr:FAD-dependent thymidylate synthase [Terriglobia bacterium]